MKKALALILIMVVGLSVFGCGKQQINPTDEQKKAADEIVTNVTSLLALISNPNSEEVMKLISLISDAIILAGNGQSAASFMSDNYDWGKELDCVTVNDSADGISLAYDCSLTGSTINGSMAIASVDGVNTFDCDLTMSVTNFLVMEFDGSVAITDSSINGSLSYSGEIASTSFKMSVVTDFDSITLDQNRCPTGGVSESTIVTNGITCIVTVEYGPDCGDISALRNCSF